MVTRTAAKKTTTPAKKTAAKKTAAPVKKTTARPAPVKKSTPAKKTTAPARKSTGSASKPVAKKTAAATPAKRAATKSVEPKISDAELDAPASDESYSQIINLVVDIIMSGDLDAEWTKILAAVDKHEEDMVKQYRAEEKKKAAKKSTTVAGDKSVPMPTRAGKTFTPEIGSTYGVEDGHKLAGAKVKFLGFHQDDDKKSRVEIVGEIPGVPEGKKFVVATSALKKLAQRRRTARKV